MSNRQLKVSTSRTGIRFDVSVQEGFIATGLEFVEKPHNTCIREHMEKNNLGDAQQKVQV